MIADAKHCFSIFLVWLQSAKCIHYSANLKNYCVSLWKCVSKSTPFLEGGNALVIYNFSFVDDDYTATHFIYFLHDVSR